MDVNFDTEIIASGGNFITALSTDIINITADMDIGIGVENIYHGATTVIPSVVAQELHTENKLVERDIIIEEIPYSRVTNLAGGWTVTIA